jgi:hypothetical protein
MTPKACCAAALIRSYPRASGGSERNLRTLSSLHSSAEKRHRAPAWKHPLALRYVQMVSSQHNHLARPCAGHPRKPARRAPRLVDAHGSSPWAEGPRATPGQDGESSIRVGARAQQQGFVLVATLWFVALLALVAVIIGGWVERSLGRASALQDRITARSEMIGAVNRVTFLMLTSYFSPRGLEVLTPEDLASTSLMDAFGFSASNSNQFVGLDDRPYRLGDVVIKLQDDHGLYRLNFPDVDTLGRLLAEYGVSYGDSAVLNDRLLDYIDKSPLMRLNGANADSYLRAGRPPPRNNPLLTPWGLIVYSAGTITRSYGIVPHRSRRSRRCAILAASTRTPHLPRCCVRFPGSTSVRSSDCSIAGPAN